MRGIRKQLNTTLNTLNADVKEEYWLDRMTLNKYTGTN